MTQSMIQFGRKSTRRFSKSSPKERFKDLGHEAEAHAEEFNAEKDATYNRMTDESISRFCDAEYKIELAETR